MGEEEVIGKVFWGGERFGEGGEEGEGEGSLG